MAPNSGGRRRLQRPDRSSTPEFRASGNAVLAGTAGRDDRASCVVRRYDHYRAVRIFTLRHHYPSKPMMRRSQTMIPAGVRQMDRQDDFDDTEDRNGTT